ncbi:MAG: NotI family restriction endonuclease [Anaerolineae bacterium]|nr:NotI family restriction endonuclease [Anaerolineae bacterium]
MSQSKQPLAEVYGHLVNDQGDLAKQYRSQRLCPFNNVVPRCTKDKAKDPLGVCSIYHENTPVITCAIRFREGWIVAKHAADFFFEPNTRWTYLTEVRLNMMRVASLWVT